MSGAQCLMPAAPMCISYVLCRVVPLRYLQAAACDKLLNLTHGSGGAELLIKVPNKSM